MDKLSSFFNYLDQISNRGMRRGLEGMQQALLLLDHPQKKYPIIHLAGTNGKGSSCTFLSQLLCESGYKVGMTLSPHVEDYRERIQINHQMIPVDDLISVHEELLKKIPESLSLTYFEWTILLALTYFAQQEVDFAILETGMGGRWDATNACSAVVTGITTIGYDHMQYLGDTLEKILAEKIEIIKESPDFLFGSDDLQLQKLAQDYCRKRKTRYHHVSEFFNLKETFAITPPAPSCQEGVPIRKNPLLARGGRGSYMIDSLQLDGSYLKQNLHFALSLGKILETQGYKIDFENFSHSTHLHLPPSRLEIISEEPLIILDGAHNEQGLKALKTYLIKNHQDDYDLIFGCLNDRDFKELAQLIRSPHKNIWALFNAGARRTSLDIYKQAQLEYGGEVRKINMDFLKDLKKSQTKKPIVVCGSFYLTGQFKTIWRNL